MSDVVIGTLRLRGPHASRLARVAATTLPAALDEALAGYPDGRVDVVSVPYPGTLGPSGLCMRCTKPRPNVGI